MIKHQFRYRKLWLIIGWAMVLLVIYGSLTSKPVQVDIRYFDKISHLLSYFVLMGWFVQLYPALTQHIRWGSFFIGLGVLLEYLQALGGVRYFEWNDMLANTTGVLLAFAAARTRFAQILSWLDFQMTQMHH